MAADTLGLTTGGTNRVTINSSGRIGIGTTDPSSKLHVIGDLLLDDTGGTRLDIKSGTSAID
jgi:hypothetical protein